MMEIQTQRQTQHIHELFIVTGLSGAGKTSVMRALEDAGCYCVDNLPIPLMATFHKLVFQGNLPIRKVVLGVDVRSEQFLSDFFTEFEKIKKQEPVTKTTLIFVDARDQTIIKRFQETRRKHPLAGAISLEQAIVRERQLLEPVTAMADVVLDTDVFNIHQLRALISDNIQVQGARELTVNIVSFGFKYGVPPESNVVFDLRFLPNPYFIPALKELDGRTQDVQSYLFHHATVQEYWQRLVDFLGFCLQKFYEEGRFAVTVAVGCTGGKHRSVAFVERLSKQSLPHMRFLVSHRDLGKE